MVVLLEGPPGLMSLRPQSPGLGSASPSPHRILFKKKEKKRKKVGEARGEGENMGEKQRW